MTLRQRLDSLEQAIQPGGRFFVMRPDPTLDLDEQIEAYTRERRHGVRHPRR
jgi:hypothetical protein